MQQGVIAGDEEMNERDRQRLESVERRMESLSEREELMEVSAYDASRAATKLEEHITAFNSILVKAQEIAAEDKLKELEAAEEARQKGRRGNATRLGRPRHRDGCRKDSTNL